MTPLEGDRVAKVRRKIFAFLPRDDAASLGAKLPASAGFALTLPCVSSMGYGLGRHGWITVDLAGEDVPTVTVLNEWVVESYRAVAPKTLAARLES